METRNILNQRNAKIGAVLFLAVVLGNRGLELATESAGEPVCYTDTIDTSAVSTDVSNLLSSKGYTTDDLVKLGPASDTINGTLVAEHKKYSTVMEGDSYSVCVVGRTVVPGDASKFSVNDK